MADGERRIVATYNVHGWVDAAGRRDPARAAQVLAEIGADVVALQEAEFPGDHAEFEARELTEGLAGYRAILGPTLVRGAAHFGNALLTRLPVRCVERLDLSIAGREPRGALEVTLEGGGGPLRVVATHLGLALAERRAQVARLLHHLRHGPDGPLLVLGDLNEWLPGSGPLRGLDLLLGRTPRLRTYPARRPLLALDRLWMRPRERLAGLRVHRTAAALRASDHLPLVGEVAPSPDGA